MTNNLADIVNVQIEIQTPAIDSADFGTLLLVGDAPNLTPEKPLPDVGVYTSLKAVKEAGWLPASASTPADPVYAAANVAFSQSPQPAKIMIAVRKTVSKGEGNETVPEPIADTLDRALNRTGWYGVAPVGIASSEYDAIAAWTEANEKLFGFTLTDIESPLTVNTYMRTFGIYGKIAEGAEIPNSNLYAHIAWFCKCFNYEPGSETWGLKTLSTIEPAALSGTEMQDLKDGNFSYYTTYAGKNVTQGGMTVGGEWIDVIRFRDWLKNDMQLRLFNLLVTNPKIPYTDQGIALVENQMISSLKQGQKQGGIAGDEFDEDDNRIPGFVVSVPKASFLTASDKASRVLRGCKFHARIAGAVHVIEVNGTLAYDEEVIA